MKKLLAIIALALLSSIASAKTIKIQIPFNPGYFGDLHARSLADYLTRNGHEAVVINSPVGGGNTALDTVANDRDSHIITQAGSGWLAFYVANRNPYGTAQVSFMYPVGWNQWVVYQSPTTNYTNPKSFDRASYASSGVGSSSHLYFAMIDAKYQSNMIHLPYKGSSAAALDVSAGRVSYMVDTAQASVRLAPMGIKPAFILADKRNQLFPTIPTAKEAGMTALKDVYDYSTLYYVVNANFDPELKRTLAQLIDQHNRQYTPLEYEQKFGVTRPAKLNPADVDARLKRNSEHVGQLQKQFNVSK